MYHILPQIPQKPNTMLGPSHCQP
uniref:Uncharacterized protein n=1 Tax=Tetranychus urticae TaxID=32264 RepID=T1KP97_TETUR